MRRAYRSYLLYIKRDEHVLAGRAWFADRGDETLRLNYPNLDKTSVVLDVGGYKGDFAKAIHDKYGCTVYLFEPHPLFFSECVERFSENDRVIPLNYGLSNVDGEFFLSNSVDSSSFNNPNHKSAASIKCAVREFFNVIDELGISTIDLMKINIEGGEYPLLNHISSVGAFPLVRDYQIQFHNFIDNAIEERNKISNDLSKTHSQTWCYPCLGELAEKNQSSSRNKQN